MKTYTRDELIALIDAALLEERQGLVASAADTGVAALLAFAGESVDALNEGEDTELRVLLLSAADAAIEDAAPSEDEDEDEGDVKLSLVCLLEMYIDQLRAVVAKLDARELN